MESGEVNLPKYRLGRITNKYIIMDIIFVSFYKQKGIIFLLRISRSFRKLLIENFKAASFYAEDALDHIQDLPCTISQIDLPRALFFIGFVLLNGDRVYIVADKTLYEYSVRDLTHPIATNQLNDYV